MSKQDGFANKNKEFSDSVPEDTAKSTAIPDQLAYLKAGWPGVPESVLFDALAILNGAGVNQ